jgi:hypothetical protein
VENIARLALGANIILNTMTLPQVFKNTFKKSFSMDSTVNVVNCICQT